MSVRMAMYKQMLDDRSNRNKLSPHEAVICMNEMMASYYHLECMDAVKDTTLWNQDVKQKGNAFMKVLEPHAAKGAEMLWGFEDAAYYNLMNHLKELFSQLTLIRPEHMALLNELLKAFFAAPELVCHRQGIKIVDDGK